MQLQSFFETSQHFRPEPGQQHSSLFHQRSDSPSISKELSSCKSRLLWRAHELLRVIARRSSASACPMSMLRARCYGLSKFHFSVRTASTEHGWSTLELAKSSTATNAAACRPFSMPLLRTILPSLSSPIVADLSN